MVLHDPNQRKNRLIRKQEGIPGSERGRRTDGGFRAALPAMLLLLSLGGCVYSIQPWYEAGSGGADPALLGVWREADGGDSWVFLAAGDSLCLLSRESGQTSEFAAVSFRVKDQNFLDLTPTQSALGSGSASSYLLPLHGIHSWSLDQDTLWIGSLNPQTLETRLAERTHPALDQREDRLVFLGTQQEMCAFVAQELLDPSLYGEPMALIRERGPKH